MRHRVAGKNLSRTPTHRRALRRNLAMSLVQHGAIRTTEAKAKELRRFIERLITTARKGTLHARRLVLRELGDRDMFDDEGERLEKTVVQKLFDEVAPRFADRPGGYTRIIRLADRRIGDSGQQVVLQLLEEAPAEAAAGPETASRRRRRAAKRHEAAANVAEATEAPAEEAPEQTEAGEGDEPKAEEAEAGTEGTKDTAEAGEEPGSDEKNE